MTFSTNRLFVRSAVYILCLALMSACATVKHEQKSIQKKFGYNDYKESVRDAVIADSSEIYDKLTVISPENTDLRWNTAKDSVLVCSFLNGAYKNSYPVGKSVAISWGEMWVTAVPELQKKIKSFGKISDNKLRIEQLLGLPPGTKNTHFVEFLVSPKDLFRPAPDKEISDNTAEILFSDFSDASYKQWFADKILYSYYTKNPYPWTRLGYTYDWGNPESEVGLSEFVLLKGAVIQVKAIYPLDVYLKN